jgi:signal transduction histidine kinase/ligand-binding sensor domain-containing protein
MRSLGYAFALAGTLLPWCPGARALDPALDVNQYAHTVWKIRDGFFKGVIPAIAQTPDGYLWLGTEFGLIRFDGVKAEAWQPPGDQPLPSNFVMSLLTTRDGTLWIGTTQGLARWKDGKLTRYKELAGQFIFTLLEEHEEMIWVGSGGREGVGRLCAIRSDSVECYGKDGTLGRAVNGLYIDRNGSLWAGVPNGVWRWKPGPPRFYPVPNQPDGIQGFSDGDDGALLICTRSGIKRLVDGKIEPYPLSGAVPQFVARRLLRDRNGGLWIGTQTQGLVHVHQGRTDVFSPSGGLSGENAYSLFEDREGSIWVATNEGLDRFRDLAVATLSVSQGLPDSLVVSILAARDGSVWLGTHRGLSRWKNGQITIAGTGSTKRDGKINGLNPTSPLFQDDRGRTWIATLHQFGYLENESFVSISGLPGGNMLSIIQDTVGNLWVINEDVGLFRLSARSVVQRIRWVELGYNDHASVLAADPTRGGLWIGFLRGGVAYFNDGQIRRSYGAADGLGGGNVSGFHFDQEGTLWIATEGGLSRLKSGRVATLSSKNGLPCDTVHWIIQDRDYSSWLYTSCGLVRIDRAELDAWSAAVDKDGDTKQRIQATVFDSSDGVRSLADAGHYRPQVAMTPDGRIWFLPFDGVSVIDPQHLPFNKLPPPVHIERITADHKAYYPTAYTNGRVPLPALTRDLAIDYTALSLVAPEKVRFRYKLEGLDRDWHDAGNRREAFYSNLQPRNYHFRVMACNNSGVWNEEGAFLDFSIAPAYYQTNWFRLSWVAAVLALLWAVYQLRLRQMAQEFNMRLDERVNERTRIARELHDTLLQSFHGLLMRFQAVSNELDEGAPKQELDETIDRAARAITEGRDAVQGLRSSALESNDLAAAIGTLGRELAAAVSQPPEFTMQVEGSPRELHPILRDEVYRVAGEALRNAFRHANARRVEVEIRYDERYFRLRVRDDGKGIDPTHLADSGPTGHFGLRGMRERAKRAEGKLRVWSSDPRTDGEKESGTEVELSIPAARAYKSFRAARRSWLAEKVFRQD